MARPEIPELAPVEGMLGILAAGEMAQHQRDLDVAEPGAVRRQLGQLVEGKPQAVDAGIDMEGGGRSFARFPPDGDLSQAAEAGAQAMADHARRIAGGNAIQHIDIGRRQQGAQRGSLLGCGDEECPDPGGGQDRRHARHAEAIGIRLDRGRGLRRPGLVGEQPPIVDDGTEIDGEDGALVVLGEIVAWVGHTRHANPPPRGGR